MCRTELVTDPAGSGELPALSRDVLLQHGEHQSLGGFCREACAALLYRAEPQESVSRAELGLPQDECMAQGPPGVCSPCADPNDETHPGTSGNPSLRAAFPGHFQAPFWL